MIDILDAVTLAGSRFKPNDDAFGRAWNRAWVIDGATGLGDPIVSGTSDAAWLASRASELFAVHARLDDTEVMMAAVAADLEAAFALERGRAPLERWETPCASFMLLTDRRDGTCELAWLGDCRAILRTEDDVTHAFGATPGSGEAQEAKQAAGFAMHDPVARVRTPEALALLRAGRARYNQSGGPAILSPDPSFAAHVVMRRVPIKRPAHALLMTDGFAALELRYLDMAEPAFIPSALENGLTRLAQRLRRIEEDMDPTGEHFPRWKRSDDATAALLALA